MGGKGIPELGGERTENSLPRRTEDGADFAFARCDASLLEFARDRVGGGGASGVGCGRGLPNDRMDDEIDERGSRDRGGGGERGPPGVRTPELLEDDTAEVDGLRLAPVIDDDLDMDESLREDATDGLGNPRKGGATPTNPRPS